MHNFGKIFITIGQLSEEISGKGKNPPESFVNIGTRNVPTHADEEMYLTKKILTWLVGLDVHIT